MSRRYSSVGLMRRQERGADGVVQSYASILGANLVEMWHASMGIALVGGAVQTWVGQIRGITVTAPSAGERPPYIADGAFFRGKPVVQSTVTQHLANGAATALWPTGTRPYLFGVGRFRIFPAGTAWVFRALNTGFSEEGPSVVCLGGTNIGGGTGFAQATFSDTSAAHDFEVGLTSAGVSFIGPDGVRSTLGSGISITGDRTQIGVGGNIPSSNMVEYSHALWLACAAEPPATQIAAIRALAKAEWGY